MNQELKDMVKCQQSKGYNSCWSCKKLLDCNIRKDYVKAVYVKLNPDFGKNNNGFEF